MDVKATLVILSNKLYKGKYGGEYDLFASDVDRFFKALEELKVTSYVVFDGYDRDQSEGRLGRGYQHLQTIKDLSTRSDIDDTKPYLSCLTSKVFRDCLRSQASVRICMADGDADPKVISLARKYRWPVVGNDSDFLLCHLEGGVIQASELMEKLLNKELKKAISDVEVRIYYAKDLKVKYDIQLNLLPLLALTIGSEKHDPRETIQKFLKEKDLEFEGWIRIEKKHLVSEDRIPIENHISVIKTYKDQSQAVEDMVRTQYGDGAEDGDIDGDNQRQLSERLHKILAEYNPNERQRDVGDSAEVGTGAEDGNGYEDGDGAEYNPNDVVGSLQERPYINFSKWFWRKYRVGRVPVRILKLFFEEGETQCDVLQPQMEDLSQPSSLSCGLTVRTALYCFVKLKTSMAKTKFNVKEWQGSEMKMSIVPADNEIMEKLYPNHENGEPWTWDEVRDILQLTDEQKKGCRRWSFEGYQLKMALIFYWCHHAQPRITRMDLIAALQCMDGVHKLQTQIPTRESPHMGAVHAFAQLQAVTYDIIDLLEMLEVEYDLNLAQIMKGSAYHQLCIRDPEKEVDVIRKRFLEENSWQRCVLVNVDPQILTRDYQEPYLDLTLSGIPVTRHEKPLAIVTTLAAKMEVSITEADLIKAYRTKNRNIYVKFHSQIMRDKLYEERKHLQTKGITTKSLGFSDDVKIYINEVLDKKQHELFLKALKRRKELNYLSIWTYHGNICMKKDSNSVVLQITSSADLSNLE